jgi:hypothetical protein
MTLPMSQDEMLEVVKKLAEDKEPVTVKFSMFDLFMLIAQLQLITRHPELSEHQLKFAKHMGKQFQKAITGLHPEAEAVINTGWDSQFDVAKQGEFINPHAPREVHNIYTLYSDDESETALLSFEFRPQDWGDPRWQYRKTETSLTINEQSYRHISHFWIEQQMSDADFFNEDWVGKMMCTVLLPGCEKELCGRDFLDEEDFWNDEWGKMPPHHESENDDDF